MLVRVGMRHAATLCSYTRQPDAPARPPSSFPLSSETGPNIFTALSALRYAGASGNATWLASVMPTLRAMLGFLEPAWNAAAGLYSAPGSLQIDGAPRG